MKFDRFDAFIIGMVVMFIGCLLAYSFHLKAEGSEARLSEALAIKHGARYRMTIIPQEVNPVYMEAIMDSADCWWATMPGRPRVLIARWDRLPERKD